MDDATQAKDRKGMPSKPKLSGRITPLNWGLLIVFGLFVVAMIYGAPIVRWCKGRYAASLAAKSVEMMDREEWMAAAETLRDARTMRGSEPEVMRAQARFLAGTRMDPGLLAQTLEQLIEMGEEEPGDRFEIVRVRLSQGETAKAKAMFESIPEVERKSPEGLKLLAALQVVEGRPSTASQTIREAFDSDEQDQKSGLRLALLNSQNTFPEIQKQAQEKLWEYARQGDEVGMEALGYLVNRKDLSLEEAETLLGLVENHPEAGEKHRYVALSAVMRLAPERREDIFERELALHEGRGVDDLIPVLSWLAREKQHTRIRRLVPPEVAAKSRQVFPIVVQSLIEDERWADLKALLTEKTDLPVPKPVVDLWLAEAFSHLEPDMIQAAQRLRAAFEAAVREENENLMVASARLADRIQLRDLALEIYDKLAAENPRMKAPLMAKALEQGREKKDAEVMLGAARRLHQARPENREQEDQLNFLRLVTGEEIELVDLSGAQRAESGLESDRAALLAALMAYRLWLPREMMESLERVKDPGSLDAGWRAVYAGLMAEGDRPAKAFEVAERVPEQLLIDEELHFLEMAK